MRGGTLFGLAVFTSPFMDPQIMTERENNYIWPLLIMLDRANTTTFPDAVRRHHERVFPNNEKLLASDAGNIFTGTCEGPGDRSLFT